MHLIRCPVLGFRLYKGCHRKLSMMAEVGQLVTFPSTNAKGAGQCALFGDPSKNPLGLLVIHEWWGMNNHIRGEGDMISKQGGFTVLVPDMYRGKTADDRETAGHLMSGLDWEGALLDITGATNFLLSKGCAKIGITGFCMGGALAFAAAARCPEISAAAPFYGIPGSQLADLTTIKIPVQAHFAEKDEVVGFSSPADYNPLHDKLKAAKVDFEMFTYDTGHGFTNPKNPSFDKDIKATALSRMYSFMQTKLKGSNL